MCTTGPWLGLYVYSLEGKWPQVLVTHGSYPSFWLGFPREFLPMDGPGQKNCRTGNKDGCFWRLTALLRSVLAPRTAEFIPIS